MDPLTLASTAISIGTTLDQASSKARSEREMAVALMRKKAETTKRTNINIQNRKSAGQRERADISSSLASSGFAESDSELLARSLDTEFSDISNIESELNWENTQTDIQKNRYLTSSEATKKGAMYSAAGTILGAAANDYTNDPNQTLRKSIDSWWKT